MVVFTCQHCNAALKKPAVEKHYNTVCRRNPYLTCVDCLVDFRGEEYTSHTSCVSEDQRYGDSNFVPKPVAVKQNNWIEVVKSVIQNNENPKFKPIFQKLLNYSNVPRKKPKFVNFLKNALKVNNDTLAGEIFDAFQHEFMKTNKNSKADKTENTQPTENGHCENLNGSLNGTEEEPTAKSKKKQKKDKKRNRESESSDVLPKEINELNGDPETPKKDKKKKSKKNKLNQSENEPSEALENITVDSVNLDASNCSQEGEKKKKKKKKSLSQCEENQKENHIEQETDISNIEDGNKDSEIQKEKLSKKELKKLKKKQKYEAELKAIENTENIKEDGEGENAEPNAVEDVPNKTKSKKQKKRKATASESEADNVKKQKVEDTHIGEGEASEEQPDPKNKFNWEEVIKELLNKNSDHEMSIKRLNKKVLAEYQAVKGDRETFEQLMSKFNKKINKIPGVRIIKDKAKLIPNE